MRYDKTYIRVMALIVQSKVCLTYLIHKDDKVLSSGNSKTNN